MSGSLEPVDVESAPLSAEEQAFTLQEGAYFGNVFATGVQTMSDGTQVIVNKPEMYACAGPGSNIPQLTMRFCSSQGSNCIIKTVGVCRTDLAKSPVDFSTCEGADPQIGAMYGCHTGPIGSASDTARYTQVLTVYLEPQDPIQACGNGVCEAFEAPETCSSDCRPGSLGQSFGKGLLGPDLFGLSVMNRGLVSRRTTRSSCPASCSATPASTRPIRPTC